MGRCRPYCGVGVRVIEGKEVDYEKYKFLNQDEQGKRVIAFGESIAFLVEEALGGGIEPIEFAFEQCIPLAQVDPPIVGTLYGCAIAGLWKFWVHGEALRLWHNAQFGKEVSGVVNPEMVDLPVGVQCYKHPDRLAVAEMSYKIKGVKYQKKVCGYCGDDWWTKYKKNIKIRRTLRVRPITKADITKGE